ncbi:MAG: ArsC family reductase [Kordiimonas sp.]|nr:ArsC family reductase [Kordiimonas sp.]
MLTIYGIKNCDTMKKAMKWLEGQDVSYRFHDYRKDGTDADQFTAWLDELGWEVLINKRGTTWRQLPDNIKTEMNNEQALQVMLDNPAIIKRPLFDFGNEKIVGFAKSEQEVLAAKLS